MSGVFVTGALHYDIILRAPHLPAMDETVTGTGVSYRLGGKGANQAVAAARHGATTAMAGRLGADQAAAHMRQALTRAGVDISQIQRDAGPSGMSAAIVQADGTYGAVIVSAANLALDPARIAIPPGTEVVLLQNEVPSAVNHAVAAAARAAGARVVLNAAPARPADPLLTPLVDLLVANRVEAAQMAGAPVDDLQAATEVARQLSRITPTIVTLGGEGLIHAAGGRVDHCPAFAVRPRSTHGAGDVFLGAFAARSARGDPDPEALRYAQAAAALHVAAEDPGDVTPQAVADLLATPGIS